MSTDATDATPRRTPILLGAGETASMLGVHRNTIYRWANERRIPHVRAGGAVRFDLDQLGRWIAQHSIPEEEKR